MSGCPGAFMSTHEPRQSACEQRLLKTTRSPMDNKTVYIIVTSVKRIDVCSRAPWATDHFFVEALRRARRRPFLRADDPLRESLSRLSERSDRLSADDLSDCFWSGAFDEPRPVLSVLPSG